MVVGGHSVVVLGEVLLEVAHTVGIAGPVTAGVERFR